MKKLIFCFDIDNILCISPNNNYKKSKPIKTNIRLVNLLMKNGHYVKLFTSRYMGRNKENKFLLIISIAYLSFSTKITFFDPREIHSIPNEPTPEYRSSIFDFAKFKFIRFEWVKILNIFSLTESFNGLMVVDFKK